MSLQDNYLPRLIDNKLQTYLETFGAVLLEGPKWVGKTMTSMQFAKSSIMLEENKQILELALLSPQLALSGANPRLIDEWQDAPALWDMIRYKIDTSTDKGLFILTGSTGVNPNLIKHSGAGRIARLRLDPMSLYESGESSGKVSLKDLFSGQFTPCLEPSISLEQLAYFIVRGGWPANLKTKRENASLIPSQYITATIDTDIFKLDETKRDVSKMKLLLRSLARNESTTVSNSKINQDIFNGENQLHTETLNEYLNIFERLNLFSNQNAFGFSIRSSVRVKNAVKRHFCDPSLASALLGLNTDSMINDLTTFGFLFEALCERDLRIYSEANDAELYHYQDYKNREIDAVVEWKDGRWAGFEIKLGSNKIEEAAKNLLTIQKEIEADPKGKKPEFLAIICGLCEASYQRKDGIYIFPLTALKN